MSTPYDNLHKLSSISRWNELRAYNSLQMALQDSHPHQDPYFGERYSRDGSTSNYDSSPSVDSDCTIHPQNHINLDPELRRNDSGNYYAATVLSNKRNLSPHSKLDGYPWNSSIDQQHTYYSYHDSHIDPYDLNEYLATHPDLRLSSFNSSPTSNEESNNLHEDAHASPLSRTPQRDFQCSYPNSISPTSETSPYFSPERNKNDGLEARITDISHIKDHAERPKRRKNNKPDGEDKICGVCGDSAKSLHFGGMACDSCKAFFRRSVQTKSHHSFKCCMEQNCKINKQNRKTCQFCRFQKCLHIGMEIRWVMPESERMDLWKSKLARHREVKANSQVVAAYSPPSESSSEMTATLSQKDTDALRDITILQEVIFSSSPYPPVCNNSEDLSNVFLIICQKLQKFFFRIEEFQQLCTEDQGRVMKGGIASSIYIHGAYLYDVDKNSWPCHNNKPYMKVPTITNELLQVFTVFSEIYNVLMSFYREYGRQIKDETVLALLCLIALFFEPPPEVKGREEVIIHRNYFIQLLKRYLIDRSGADIGQDKFSHLMGCYQHTKKIVAYHNKVSIEPNFKPRKIVHWNVSFDGQMNLLIAGLRQSRMAGLPEFASVFGPSKVIDKRLQKVDKNAAYAWLTSVIFGYETKADTLLSFFPPEILIQKRPFGALDPRDGINQLP